MARTINPEALRRLIQQRIATARAAGRHHVRNPMAFEDHLVTVACSARRVAQWMADAGAAPHTPDPAVCFLAGAWHDAGKICSGDDYHEVTAALELVQSGQAWGLAAGPDADVVLQRAARAVLPHFALWEQLQANYGPTSGTRDLLPTLLTALEAQLGRLTFRDFLPLSAESLILIYCDLAGPHAVHPERASIRVFARRWNEIKQSAQIYDPAILAVLPIVKPRIWAAYTLVVELLRASIRTMPRGA